MRFASFATMAPLARTARAASRPPVGTWYHHDQQCTALQTITKLNQNITKYYPKLNKVFSPQKAAKSSCEEILL